MANRKIILDEKHQELYNKTRAMVKKANQRLVRIEREQGSLSWAGRNLKAKLDTYAYSGWTKGDRVKINKSMSMTELRKVNKAVDEFLHSNTSKISGIRNTIKKQKEELKKSLSSEYEDTINNLSDSEIESIYLMFSDDYAKDVISFTGSSELAQAVADAKVFKRTETQFLEYMKENFIEYTNDSDMKEKLIHIYNKFVK